MSVIGWARRSGLLLAGLGALVPAGSAGQERAAPSVAAAEARVDLVGARYDYVLARAELEAVVGREL